MNRRKFVGWMGVGAIASSLPVAIAASFPDPSHAQNSQSVQGLAQAGQARFVNIGSVKDLEKNGSILNKKHDVLVVRDPVNKTLSAVDPACTHSRCTVRWEANYRQFSCPCHGSRFNLQGSATKEPARKPLKRYPVKEENGSILVKIN